MRGLLAFFELVAWSLWLAKELMGWLAWVIEAVLTLIRFD
jgi:hypothetical protein